MRPMMVDLFSKEFIYAMSIEAMQAGLTYTAHYKDEEFGHMQKMWLDPLYMLLLGTHAWGEV